MREYTESDIGQERRPKRSTTSNGSRGPREGSDRTQMVRELRQILEDQALSDGRWVLLREGWPEGHNGESHPWSHYATTMRASWYVNDDNPERRAAAVGHQGRLPAPPGRFEPVAAWREDGTPILRVRVVQPGDPKPKWRWQGAK